MGRRLASFFFLLGLVACGEPKSSAARATTAPSGLRQQPVTVTAAEVRTGTASAPLSKGRAGEHKFATHNR
jgi:hypothetical protein